MCHFFSLPFFLVAMLPIRYLNDGANHHPTEPVLLPRDGRQEAAEAPQIWGRWRRLGRSRLLTSPRRRISALAENILLSVLSVGPIPRAGDPRHVLGQLLPELPVAPRRADTGRRGVVGIGRRYIAVVPAGGCRWW